ncbi:MAG: terminase family protein [Bacillota bacterium]
MSASVQLTEDELLQAQILADPVQWAYVYLNWEARWYQREILRDSANRLVLRMGRRTGKTETLAVYCLWYSFTNRDKTCVIVTPYENQITVIWEMLEKFISRSPELQMSIRRKSKNPYIVEFHNGSRIKGFTAGTKAGSGGANIRGQGADVIILDEADYLVEADIVAVTAIALEAPSRIRIILSSTPTGKREYFYRACTEKNSPYKQYHFSSHVNPEWDEQADEEFRLFHSEIDYQHEVLAEFGEETSGVFNKALVEKAAHTLYYAYSKLSAQQRRFVAENGIEVLELGPYNFDVRPLPALRTMGVDWDKYGATPQIVITEYNEKLQRFQVVLRESIPKSEFTLDHAVNRIVELNSIYNPAVIYCDRGYGEYQVETLRAYGLKHPETGLARKVKGWAFNQSIELVDPSTKEVVNKPLKHFMVNQTALMFERERLLISPFDDELYSQIINYSVVRRTSTGQPVYTSKNEHALDAMMLSILAFVLEFPDVASTLVTPTVNAKVFLLRDVYARQARRQQQALRADRSDGRHLQPVSGVSLTWGQRGTGGFYRRRIRI